MWGGGGGRQHCLIDSILHSDGELGPVLPGTNHQNPKTDSSKRVEPEQRGRPAEDSLHPLPSHPPLPRGLLVLQSLDFLCGSSEKCKAKASTVSALLQNSNAETFYWNSVAKNFISYFYCFIFIIQCVFFMIHNTKYYILIYIHIY